MKIFILFSQYESNLVNVSALLRRFHKKKILEVLFLIELIVFLFSKFVKKLLKIKYATENKKGH